MCLKVLIFGGILCTVSASSPCANPQVLSEGQKVTKTAKSASQLEVYLHKALREQVSATFTDVFLSISLRDANDFRVYQAHNCSGVLDEHEQDNRYFGLLKSVNSWRAHHLPPFNDTYVGITASKAYSVGISVWHVNYIRVALFLGGILLFLFAGALVRNVVFYYTSGCSIGLLASVLVVAIIVYRIAPKKTIGIPILLGGWSFAAYMLHFAWDNCASILQQYQEYVIGYFTLAFLISFAICYKRGPPTDERSHDIAQWTLQLIALLLVYFSTQIPKVSYATIAILILHQATRSWLWRLLSSVWNFLAWIWLKLFPRKRKLLSQEEYDREARETTRKELAKLRAYCRSPEANAWKITHSVRNPKRLARFIDGTEDHISDEEYVEHDLEGDRLDPDTDLFTEEDDYEHEIIIRRRSRHGLASPLDPAERSILIPRGVSSQELLDRISASTVPERRAPKVARRTRHSLGGGGHAAHIPPPPPRQPLARESRVPPRRTAPKPKKATSSRSTMSFRSHEYFSSDSEDQATYEEELLARGDEFDFERD